jgi:hypothetical protein
MKQSSTFRRTPPPSRSPASLLEEDLIRGEPTQSESSHPSSFFTKMNEGKRLFKQGAYEEAGQAFLQASFLDRYAYAAHWGVALSFFARERYSSTASSFRTGFQQITNPFAVRENFISYYGDPRNFETHLTRLKGYLARYPYDLETQFVLALLYFYTQDYVKSQNVLLYILKIDPQYEEAQRLEDSIQREIQRREQYQMPALQKDLKKSIPQENFFTPEFSPKKASEAKGTESFSSPETPLPAFKEESFPPHPQEGAEEEKGEKESETFSPTPEGEKEEAQIEGEEQSSLSKEEELFSALEEGVNSQENQVSTISEEEKKSIESNNAEALENYEKLLNYARSTSKTPSPPPSSSSAKALEVQKVKDQLAEKKKRLETAQKEAQRQKERGEFTEEQYQRVLKLLAQKYAKDSAELQAEIARLEAQ